MDQLLFNKKVVFITWIQLS